MSEIGGPSISVNQLKYAGIQKQAVDVPVEPTEVSEETPQIKDFSNSKAEVLQIGVSISTFLRGKFLVNSYTINPPISETRVRKSLVLVSLFLIREILCFNNAWSNIVILLFIYTSIFNKLY